MVEATCTACGLRLLVIPPTIREEIHEELLDDVEAHVAGISTPEGQRLVIADASGFTCPVCGARGDTPSA